MTARDRIHAMFNLDESAERELDTRLDAYRTEVITKTVGRLRAVPVDCTALTGPVWYGDGWNAAITTFEEIADYQKPDDEAYPGELQRLRALNLGLRAALLRRDDVEWARQQLVSLAVHEAKEREMSTASSGDAPDFFQPGRTYRSEHDGYTAPELIVTFRVEHVTRHPDRGHLRAIGWMRTGEPGTGWHGDFRDEGEFDGWTDVTEAVTE